MNPEQMAAIKEAYQKRTMGAGSPQPSMGQPQGAPQPTQGGSMGGMSGGAEGMMPGGMGQVNPEHEIQKIAAQALAKRLNGAAKV